MSDWLGFQEKIEGLLEGSVPQVVFLLAGSYVATGDPAMPFRSGWYDHTDNKGLITGSRSRVLATAELYKLYPSMQIVAASRDPKAVPPEPIEFAHIMRDELIELGVPEQSILLEEKSHTTLTELVEMVKLIRQYEWDTVIIITNRYHSERVALMYAMLMENSLGFHDDIDFQSAREALKKRQLQVRVVCSEDILNAKSSYYRDLEVEAQETEAYKKRVEAEKKGVEDLRQGRYFMR